MSFETDRRTLLGATAALAATRAGQSRAAAAAPPGLADFDFLIGRWRVRHRRLKARLDGSADWAQFDGTSVARKILAGFGNMDENRIGLPGGAYTGVTLRLFDPAKQTWTIWWMDSRTPGALDASVSGAFKNGVGTFFGDDVLRGRPIKVRYQWTRSSANACHWEQAFSPDAGKSWETNWTMDFTRI